MKIMPNDAKLAKSIATIVSVYPRPQTLAHTSAILSGMQKYGEIISFKYKSSLKIEDSTTSPERGTIFVRFLEAGSAKRAIEASPIAVEVDCDLPDPKLIDPYDVRGFQIRSWPGPARFSCKIALEDKFRDAAGLAEEQKDLDGGGLIWHKHKLYEDLLRTGAPNSITEGLATDTQRARDHGTNKNPRLETRSNAITESAQLTSASLMSLWRQSMTSGPPGRNPTLLQKTSQQERKRQRLVAKLAPAEILQNASAND